MLPFEFPEWSDDIYTNAQSLYNNFTYRSIIKIFFNEKCTIYKIVTFKATHITKIESTTLYTFLSRSTFLIELIKAIEEPKMKSILKLFLRHTNDINFLHPCYHENSLNVLQEKLQNQQHNDLLKMLLQRKEILQPQIIATLAPCIIEDKHIEYILEAFAVTIPQKHYMYSQLFKVYFFANGKKSRRIMQLLINKSDLEYSEFTETFFNKTTNPDNMDYMPLVDWKNLDYYIENSFVEHMQKIFNTVAFFKQNAHAMLFIYKKIIMEYNITVCVDREVLEFAILYAYSPQLIILLDCMLETNNFLHILPVNTPEINYIKKRFRRRYTRFIHFWRHKTYAPGSKVFLRLCDTYRNIMPNNLK